MQFLTLHHNFLTENLTDLLFLFALFFWSNYFKKLWARIKHPLHEDFAALTSSTLPDPPLATFATSPTQCFNWKLTQLLGCQGEWKHSHSLMGLILNCNTLSSPFTWLSSHASFLRIYKLDDLRDKNDAPNTPSLCKVFSHSLAN